MSRHYCKRCGLNMNPSTGRTNIQWLIEHKITLCNECNPKLWEELDSKNQTRPIGRAGW